MQNEVEQLLGLAKKTALAAHQKLSEFHVQEARQHTFSESLPREMKALADQVMDEVVLKKLLSTGLHVLSEESGDVEGSQKSSLRFIVDPLDGTVNFVRNLAPSSISIALYDGDTPLFGVLAIYPSGDLAWGGKDMGAFLNNQPLHVSELGEVSHSITCTGFPARFQFDNDSSCAFLELISQFGKIRMLGAASLSLLQVAKGAAEVYMEQEIMLWDVAAGLAILEGAGGQISLTPGCSNHAVNVVASNGIIQIV